MNRINECNRLSTLSITLVVLLLMFVGISILGVFSIHRRIPGFGNTQKVLMEAVAYKNPACVINYYYSRDDHQEYIASIICAKKINDSNWYTDFPAQVAIEFDDGSSLTFRVDVGTYWFVDAHGNLFRLDSTLSQNELHVLIHDAVWSDVEIRTLEDINSVLSQYGYPQEMNASPLTIDSATI